MTITAQQLAEFLNGHIEGDAASTITFVAKIEQGAQGALSFLANPKYEQYLYETESSIVLVNKSQNLQKEVKATLIRVDDAYYAFSRVLEKFFSNHSQKTGREEPVFVSPDATVGENIYLGAFVYVGKNARIGKDVKLYPQVYIGDNVKVGDGTILYPGVKIYHDCVVGSNVIIHAGAVIGSDGFGFAPLPDGTYAKVPQTGNVIIEDNVEIGANTAIDRASLGSTYIRKGVKIDNLIQIAHNVEVGENTVIAAQTGIAGSTKLGKNCVIAGQVGITGHIEVADGVQVGAQAGINHAIKEPGTKLHGSPAIALKDWLRSNVLFKKLPEIEKRVTDLEKGKAQ